MKKFKIQTKPIASKSIPSLPEDDGLAKETIIDQLEDYSAGKASHADSNRLAYMESPRTKRTVNHIPELALKKIDAFYEEMGWSKKEGFIEIHRKAGVDIPPWEDMQLRVKK